MERPAKRAKVGRAPHDVLPLDSNGDANALANVNKAGNNNSSGSSSKAKKAGSKKDDDNEDEIAMDPEDYAMKIDPEYRLDRSRAVAENKLKSAFELLFEKYSQDFGDTGDEINFYTDEIEVDNGHIASLPAKGLRGRPRIAAAGAGAGSGADGGVDADGEEEEEGSDDESGEDDDAPVTDPSRADASRLLSLLPSRFGPGGTVIMGSMAHAGGYQAAAPGPGIGAIDPTWIAPEIPELAFGTPGGLPPPPPPPRSAYTVQQRAVFTKTLAISHIEALGEDGDDEDDDLILDTPNPEQRTNERTFVPKSTSPERPLSDLPSSAPLPAASDEPDGSLATEKVVVGASNPSSPKLHEPAADGAAAKPKETFSRNTLDPSYVFSDEEDFGFKRRKKPQAGDPTPVDSETPLAQTEAVEDGRLPPQADPVDDAPPVDTDEEAPFIPPVTGKRRPGRPRKSTSNLETPRKKATEPVRRSGGKGDLSIIIMTSSVPPVPEPIPEPALDTASAGAAVTPVPEPAPESPSESTSKPEVTLSPAVEENTRQPQETTPDRPRKRRRRHTEDTATTTTTRAPSSVRKAKRREIPDSQGNSSSGIISLVSDGSADEAELEEIAAATPPPFSPFGPPGSGGVGRLPLSSARRPHPSAQTTPSGSRKTPWTPSSRHRLTAASALMATPSRQRHYARAVSGSPLARRQQAIFLEDGEAPSPGGSPIQTPGGTMRRCGKDGFRCEREFCFRCT
ncbi:hypothetical protein SCUCBS95973_004573 [Sporothrix curviconia]|uniref:Uncharacterized protein n=1 Tax=Sporothrix curviconia TaxID=1260050 RepID=A0ABP0BPW6_9PEZI